MRDRGDPAAACEIRETRRRRRRAAVGCVMRGDAAGCVSRGDTVFNPPKVVLYLKLLLPFLLEVADIPSPPPPPRRRLSREGGSDRPGGRRAR